MRIAISEPGEPHADEHAAPADTGNGHAPPISPVVRRIAEQHGIDLTQVPGTGRRGRVTKKDVMAFVEHQPAEAPLHIESPYREEGPDAAPAGEPLSIMRRQIADHMVRSLRTAAHCTTVVEADMSRIEEARGRLSYLPFVARAAIAALREFPSLNATLEDDLLSDGGPFVLALRGPSTTETLLERIKKKGLVIIISDLFDEPRSPTWPSGRAPAG